MIYIPAIPAINRHEEDIKFVEFKSGNLFTYNIWAENTIMKGMPQNCLRNPQWIAEIALFFVYWSFRSKGINISF